jgi:hypothetical protein
MQEDLTLVDDLSGHQYHQWKIIKLDEEKTKVSLYNQIYWIVECSCEFKTQDSLSGMRIRSGKARKSCGCKVKKKRKEETVEQQQKRRFDGIYRNIFNRCYDENHKEHHRYGGKGIVISEEWHDFKNFQRDMWNAYLEFEAENGLNTATIDRIDPALNYTKDNCRWATQLQQARNRSSNISIEVNGKTYETVSLLAEDYPDIRYHTILARFNKGKTGEDLIQPPKQAHALNGKRRGVRANDVNTTP